MNDDDIKVTSNALHLIGVGIDMVSGGRSGGLVLHVCNAAERAVPFLCFMQQTMPPTPCLNLQVAMLWLRVTVTVDVDVKWHEVTNFLDGQRRWGWSWAAVFVARVAEGPTANTAIVVQWWLWLRFDVVLYPLVQVPVWLMGMPRATTW